MKETARRLKFTITLEKTVLVEVVDGKPVMSAEALRKGLEAGIGKPARTKEMEGYVVSDVSADWALERFGESPK